MGNRAVGTRHSLAKAMGVDDQQRLKRFQLQASSHQTILVEGNPVHVVFSPLIRPVFQKQREFISICGSVAFAGI
jgi:hypothetical protein